MLRISFSEYIESIEDILSYPQLTMGPPWLGLDKNFQVEPTSRSGLNLRGFNPGRYAFTLQKSYWANSTQVEPGFTLGILFRSVNRVLMEKIIGQLKQV